MEPLPPDLSIRNVLKSVPDRSLPLGELRLRIIGEPERRFAQGLTTLRESGQVKIFGATDTPFVKLLHSS